MIFTFEGATVYLPEEIVETTVTVADGMIAQTGALPKVRSSMRQALSSPLL